MIAPILLGGRGAANVAAISPKAGPVASSDV
jgi:hypothetical protein